ncbi:c-type cytochrome biogenesis protein CcmI [Paracoccaceae bacterium Fryx2]|nr:c-type cytochrome biogenesis protein CcmI [Paracoccaceae bacterium Fryx2]
MATGFEEWVFWGLAGAMALGVGLILVLTLLRARGTGLSPAAYDLRVYRDQLSEIDRDLARGVIGTDDAARLRTEISRRVLEADRVLGTGDAATGPGRGGLGVVVLVLLAIGGAFLGYNRLGAPGYPDMPLQSRIAMAEELRATRPSQAEAEAEAPQPPAAVTPDPDFAALMEKLRAAVTARPADLQGQELLARNEAGLGNFVAAHKAMAQVIALKDPQSSAEDHAALAELMILAAAGYVSPEAEAALTEALRRNPRNGTALYYSGMMLAQTGRPDLAFRIWRPLLEDSAPDAPWVAPLRAQIGQLAAAAGVDYQVPSARGATALPGPDAAAVDAAGAMSEADRGAMIAGMVEQLSARLASEGGTAAEWARLIGALGVLGQTDRARAIWAEAQTRFAAQPNDLAAVRAAAVQAGVAE